MPGTRSSGTFRWNIRPNETTLLYGRISTGYRGGKFLPMRLLRRRHYSRQPGRRRDVAQLRKKAGIKGLFLDQRLNLRAAAFYNDYDGYQINAIQHRPSLLEGPFSESPLVEFIDNIDGTTIWGAEAEATYYINDNWRISGFYNYLASEFGPFESIISGDPDPNIQLCGRTSIGIAAKRSCRPIRHPRPLPAESSRCSPEHKAAVTLTYETALDGNLGNLQILGTLSHTGDRFPQVQNVADQRLPAYQRVDVRGTWTSVDQRWSLTLYVQNVMDEIGLQEVRVGRAPVGTLTEPRQFGLQIGWRP